ncbi:60S acidic ribosomal protein P0, partial [Geodia barretti]
MGREDRTTWKANYFTKLIELLDTYQKVFLVTVDNVSSKQMQQIRIKLRGRATLLMGGANLTVSLSVDLSLYPYSFSPPLTSFPMHENLKQLCQVTHTHT